MIKNTGAHIVDVQLTELPDYAAYLLKDRLHDFVTTLYQISISLEIPLLKYFSGMEEKEIIRLSTEGNIKLLTAIKNNAIFGYIEDSKNNWLRNQLPIITKSDVVADDIGLISYARKKAFRQLIPDYTEDAAKQLKIIDEIDRFILSHETVLYKTYLSIQQEKLREANVQLKRREDELLEAQDLGKIGSFEWDLTGTKKSSYTPEVFKIFEFEKTTDLETFLNDVHPDDRLKLKGAMEKAFHDGSYECEYRYQRNNKNKVLYSRGKMIFEDGRPQRMVGTITDITEKANLIARLTENEELSKQAQGLTNTGNWKWSIDSDTIEWSDEMYRIYGLEPQSERITFQKFLTFIHDDDRNKRIAEISDAVKTGVASDYVMKINSLDGRQKILKGKGRVIKDKSGKSVGMLGTCQDITNEYLLTSELKKTNDELVRKNKDLESFNFIASHDLQEPLRKIQTYSNRILHEGMGSIPENLMKYFSRISQASNRMQKIIEDFLIFYHSLNSSDEIETIDLNEVMQDVAGMLSAINSTKTLKLSVNSLPKTKGRRLRLTEMFRHLLSNAIKFAKSDTDIQINISSDNHVAHGKEYVMISIADNGIGFDQKYSERIFELFQKLHSQDEYPGSGIGLSLCKKIAEDHSGWISVVSQPGVGSTFNVFIPKA